MKNHQEHQLGANYEVTIASFFPAEGGPDVTITASLAEGLGAAPGSLLSLGGRFIEEESGKIFAAPQAAIIDAQGYSEFSITVPSTITEGSYQFEIYLAGMGKGGQDKYTLKSDFPFVVKPEVSTLISRIIPSSLPAKEADTKIFQVQGKALTSIDKSLGITLTPGNLRMKITTLTDSSMSVSFSSFSSEPPKAGRYKLNAKLENGESASSIAFLEITE